MFIYPYNENSESVAALKKVLSAKVIKLEGSKFKGNEQKIVINWGNSMTNEEIEKCFVLNKPKAVAVASDKLNFFRAMGEHVPVPPWTTSVEEAMDWVESGKTVLGRKTLKGHSGQGIIVFEDTSQFAPYLNSDRQIPLFTMYIPKKSEYRVHVLRDEIVDVQEKRAKKGGVANYLIRNHANGFVFAREGVTLPKGVAENCIKAVKLCGLDFGAVDVIWNEYRETGFILEVNTAPGLEGQTIDSWGNAIINITSGPARVNVAQVTGANPAEFAGLLQILTAQ